MHRRMLAMLLLLLLIVPAVLAQDEVVESTVGPVTISHSETWNVLEGPVGTVVIAEFDPLEVTDGNLPEGAVVVQLRLFGLNRISGLLEDDITAYNIVGGLLANDPASGEEQPEIVEIEQDNFTFARVDISSPDLTSYVYVAILNNVSFGIFTVQHN